MRRSLLVAAIAFVALIAVDALVSSRVEGDAARALRADIARQTGGPPDEAEVSLRGPLAGLRLLAGPAPGVTATMRGIDIPNTRGSLTRLRVDLEDVDAHVGEVLSGSSSPGSLPFTAASGRFSAVLDGDDLAATVGPAGLLGRLDLRDDRIVAIPSDSIGAGEVPLALSLAGARPGAALLVLRPAPGAAVSPVFANATITIPLVLPDALMLEAVQIEENRLIGRGRVDPAKLIRGG